MRRKTEAVLSFESSDEGLPKVVRDYRARYRAISQVLDANPQILAAVHKDLAKLSQGGSQGTQGRLHLGEHPAGSDRPAPRRAALPRDGHPHRQRPVPPGLPADAEAGRHGFHLPGQMLPGHPARDLAARSTNCLATMELRKEMVNPAVIRTDTTVVESNIHYPTDASLLWDTWRVASRLLIAGPGDCPGKLPASLPRPEDQAAVSVRHPLHAQQVGVPPAEGESGVPQPDRADGMDRGDCREFAAQAGPRQLARRRWPWNSRRICRPCRGLWRPPGGRRSKARRFRLRSGCSVSSSSTRN